MTSSVFTDLECAASFYLMGGGRLRVLARFSLLIVTDYVS